MVEKNSERICPNHCHMYLGTILQEKLTFFIIQILHHTILLIQPMTITLHTTFIKITFYSRLHLSVTKRTVKVKNTSCLPQHSWFRHSATNWKVAGSIPDGVTGIFRRLVPSRRTIALWLTQTLTEISSRGIYWYCLEIVGASTS